MPDQSPRLFPFSRTSSASKESPSSADSSTVGCPRDNPRAGLEDISRTNLCDLKRADDTSRGFEKYRIPEADDLSLGGFTLEL